MFASAHLFGVSITAVAGMPTLACHVYFERAIITPRATSKNIFSTYCCFTKDGHTHSLKFCSFRFCVPAWPCKRIEVLVSHMHDTQLAHTRTSFDRILSLITASCCFFVFFFPKQRMARTRYSYLDNDSRRRRMKVFHPTARYSSIEHTTRSPVGHRKKKNSEQEGPISTGNAMWKYTFLISLKFNLISKKTCLCPIRKRRIINRKKIIRNKRAASHNAQPTNSEERRRERRFALSGARRRRPPLFLFWWRRIGSYHS